MIKKLTFIILILITSICFAQRKETISGTFFNIYYPNGDRLLNNAATHTIPALKGHIEVDIPPGFNILIYQVTANGGLNYLLQHDSRVHPNRIESKSYILKSSLGGPDYIIEMSYPESELSGKTIVYNIDFNYFDTNYGPDVEPNNTKDTAIAMSENTSYQGWGFSYADDANDDYYKIVAPKRGTYVITTNGHSTLPESFNLKVNFSGNNSKPFPNGLSYYSEGNNTSGPLKVHCVEKGDELFVLTQASFGSYEISYTVEESTDENDIEPNDTVEQATEISENTKIKGTIGYGETLSQFNLLPKDSEDFYKISPFKSGKLIISFKERIEVPENFITFYFREANSQPSGINTVALTADNQTFEIDCASPNKTYYLKLNANRFNSSPVYSCCNAYEISWNMQDTANAGCGFLDTADFESISDLNIYPNPVETLLNIQLTNNAVIDKIIITDSAGRRVKEQNSSAKFINVDNLATGVYFIQIHSGNNKWRNKFIKE